MAVVNAGSAGANVDVFQVLSSLDTTFFSGATSFTAYSTNPAAAVAFTGTGFTYLNGYPSGGTVTGFTITVGGQTAYTFSFPAQEQFGIAALYSAGKLYQDTGFSDVSGFETIFGATNFQFTGAGGADAFRSFASSDFQVGNAGNDTLEGGAGPDYLNGGADLDTVSYAHSAAGVAIRQTGDALSSATAQGGDAEGDSIFYVENFIGSAFADLLAGAAGANRLEGGGGADTLQGGADGDTLIGGEGIDSLEGGEGDDTLVGGLAGDVLRGDAGTDTVSYAGESVGVTVTLGLNGAMGTGAGGVAAGDRLYAVENVVGGAGADTVAGNELANVLEGGAGADSLNGGAGNDLLVAGASASSDVDQYGGGAGLDALSYAASAAGVAVALGAGGALTTGSGGDAQGDRISGIESLVGSAFADTLVGNNLDNTLEGGAGADSIDGGGGVDTASYAHATAGVTVDLGLATAQTGSGDAGGDRLANIRNLVGSGFADRLTGHATLQSTIEGGAGADTIVGGAAGAIASYASAESGVSVSLDANTAYSDGAGSQDTLTDVVGVIGSAFADRLQGRPGSADRLSGGAGNDTVLGGLGNDTMDGGGGVDDLDYSGLGGYGIVLALKAAGGVSTTSGGTTVDSVVNFENVVGSAAGDSLTGSSLDNVIGGYSGNDTLDGAAGIDTVTFAQEFYAVALTLGTSSASGVAQTVATRAPGSGSSEQDQVRNFENVIGSYLADTLVGNNAANVIEGAGGSDSLDGGGAFDTVSFAGSFSNVTLTLGAAGPGGTVAQTSATSGGDTDLVSNFEGIVGGSGADTLTGNTLGNRIDGGLGSDSLAGLAGNDTLVGGLGDDTLTADLGADSLDGGDGVDVLVFAAGVPGNVSVNLLANTISGAAGSAAAGDVIRGIESVSAGDGNDSLVGNALANTLVGGAGDDTIEGGAAGDSLDGGAAFDVVSYRGSTGGVEVDLYGLGSPYVQPSGPTFGAGQNHAAYDQIAGFEGAIGSAYADDLRGTAGGDRFDGSGGDDRLVGGAGADTLIGGAGLDTADYQEASAAVAVDLGRQGTINMAGAFVPGANPAGSQGDAAGDQLAQIERVIGTNYADLLRGDGLANTLVGYNGDDTLYGGGGNDVLGGPLSFGGEPGGEDVIYGEGGADTVIGDRGIADRLDGGLGIDTVSYAAASNGDPGNAGVTVDLRQQGATDATTGAQTSVGTAQSGADAQGDLLWGFENVLGSSYRDLLTGDARANRLDGAAGDDTIAGGFGADTLVGGLGSDTLLYAQPGSNVAVNLATSLVTGVAGSIAAGDVVQGFENVTILGNGNDTLIGNAADNVLVGGGGADSIDGGAGIDTVSYADSLLYGVVASLDGSAGGQFLNVAADSLGDRLVNIEVLVGTYTNDSLSGSNAVGPETFVSYGGFDTIDGRGGWDIADLGVNTSVALAVNLAIGNVTSGFTFTGASLRSVEEVRGGSGADTFTALGFGAASSNAGSLRTFDGFLNAFEGGAGNDTVTGNGATRVSYEHAAAGVTVDLAAGTGVGDASVGSDKLLGGVDRVRGSAFADRLLGSNNAGTSAEIFEGRAGNDFVDGLGGFDIVTYQFDPKTTSGIAVYLSDGLVRGDATVGLDTLRRVDGVIGTAFADSYDASGFGSTGINAGSDIGFGATFNDFQGEAGNDVVGGNGNTRVSFTDATGGVTVNLVAGLVTGNASVGADTLTGTNLVNHVKGSDYNDIVFANSANNRLQGEAGFDRVDYSLLGIVADSSNGISVNLANGTVVGGNTGSDTLSNVEGIRGTAGVDTYNASAFGGASTNAGNFGALNEFEGDDGNDVVTGNGSTRISYAHAKGGVSVNLATGVSQSIGVNDAAGIGLDNLSGGGIGGIRGSDFNDSLFGYANGNVVAEVFIGGRGSDRIDGGDGYDRADYSTDAVGTGGISVTVSGTNFVVMGTNAASQAAINTDTLLHIESIVGTDNADSYNSTGFKGASGDILPLGPGGVPVLTLNEFQGGGGNDTVKGNGDATGAGNTRVSYLDATAGVMIAMTGGGAGASDGNASVGHDTFTGGVNRLRGSDFADTITADNITTYVEGRDGDDILSAGKHAGTLGIKLYGGAANGGGVSADGFDTASYDGVVASGIQANLNLGFVTKAGGGWSDALHSIEAVRGTKLADTYTAAGWNGTGDNPGSNGSFNEFEGGLGDDTITGNGNTRVSYVHATGAVTANLTTGVATGADGNDSFVSITPGNVTVAHVRGSDFDDVLVGSGGANRLRGGLGTDTLTGNAGADQFEYGRAGEGGGGNGDTITDFVSGTDKFRFSKVGFGGGLQNDTDGALDAGYLVSGGNAAAIDATHGQFVFDTTSHVLYWDADGLGGIDKVAIAHGMSTVASGDFLLV